MAGAPGGVAGIPGVTPARDLARGPARLCQALAITRDQNGADLCAPSSPLRLLPGHVALAVDDITQDDTIQEDITRDDATRDGTARDGATRATARAGSRRNP